MSDVVKDFSRTVMLQPTSKQLERHFKELERRGREEMRADGLKGLVHRSLDIRYAGQGFELNVPAVRDFVKRFHAAHRNRYGHADEKRPIEIVNVRVRLLARTQKVPLAKQKIRKGNGRQAIVRRRQAFFDGRKVAAPVYDRALLRPGDVFSGPAILAEYSATTLLPPFCRGRVDAWQNVIVEVENARR
jgi:N-methylhydantoinase A